jgi:hypothetical protein
MALFGLLGRNKAAAFWRWFEKNAAHIEGDVKALREDREASQLTMTELGRRLARVHPGLVYEIGSDLDGDVELIVSADGDIALFEEVTRLVSSAPRIEGFRVTAFRPRTGESFGLGMFGKQVTFAMVRYESWPEDDRLGVKVYIAVEDLDGEELDALAFVLLDIALGEYDVTTGLGTIEVATGRPDNAKPLKDLAAEFDASRNHSVH